MKLLLDTHMIIWALTNDSRLPYAAREMIGSPDNIVFFSTASLWEIAVKNQKNPEKCPYNEKEITQYCLESGFEPMTILPSHILAIRGLKVRPGRQLSNLDPFDRLLAAQAKAEGCRFITHDKNLENYDEKCISLF